MNGFVTGYTQGTLTIDGTTFSIAGDAQLIKIGQDYKVTSVTAAELYMKNVEFVTSQGEIVLVMESASPSFTATASGSNVTITPDFDLSEFSGSTPSLTSLKKGSESVDLTGASVEFGAENTLSVTLAAELAEGSYEISFKLGGKEFKVSFTVGA